MAPDGGVYEEDMNRLLYPEEFIYKKQKITDYKKEGFINWSNIVKVKVLKYKLKPKENSFLKTSKSNYTFIRKTQV